MPMTKLNLLFPTTLCLLFGTSAFGQEAAVTTPTPETGTPAAEAPAATTTENAKNTLSMGREAAAPADGVGSTYIAATFESWEQSCVKTEDGSDPCELFQLLKDGTGNPVAEFRIFGLPADHPARPKAVAGGTIIAPLGTLLTTGLAVSIDGGTLRRYPFSWCADVGCLAQVGFTQEELDGFKKGNEAKLTISPVFAPDAVELTVSLKGFTAGYDAVNKANGN